MADPADGRRPFAWEASYPPGGVWDAPIRIGTLPDFLAGVVAEFTACPAFAYRERSLSYGEFAGLVESFATGLATLGVAKGTRVALLLPNTPWHPVAFFGVLRAGGTVVHLSPLDAEREMAFKLTDSGARILVTTDLGGLDKRAAKLVEAGLLDHCIVGGDAFWRDRTIARTEAIGPMRSAEEILSNSTRARLP